jgi:hypothetical protein
VHNSAPYPLKLHIYEAISTQNDLIPSIIREGLGFVLVMDKWEDKDLENMDRIIDKIN